MCRSIKTLRPPFTDDVTADDVRAAALQYVRKVSGFRQPAPHNRAALTGRSTRWRPPPRCCWRRCRCGAQWAAGSRARTHFSMPTTRVAATPMTITGNHWSAVIGSVPNRLFMNGA